MKRFLTYRAGQLFTAFMRCLHPATRFRVCAHFAARFAFAFSNEKILERFGNTGLDNHRDAVLYMVLHRLTERGVYFDVETAGATIAETLRHLDRTRGVLIVGTHGLMSRIVLRQIFDADETVVIVAGAENEILLGRPERPATLRPDTFFLLKLRAALRRAAWVCAELDRTEEVARRSTMLHKGNTQLHLCDPILRVASRCGSTVVFGGAHLDRRGRVQEVVEVHSGADVADADALSQAFETFVATKVLAWLE